MPLSRRDLIRLGALAVAGGAVGLGARELLAEGPGTDSSYGFLRPPDANGLRLPPGFTSRLVGRSGDPVAGTGYRWHDRPDGAACFAALGGGWILVSNSEVDHGGGGVSAVRFSASGAITDAYSIASGTNRNCSGGVTSWGTYLSCEEVDGGHVYECDPTTPGSATRRAALGTFSHEAAAEDPRTGIIYLTEDKPDGRLYRFTPTVAGALGSGRLEAAHVTGSRVRWVTVAADAPARGSSTTAFDGGEGIVVDGSSLFVTTKGDDRVWELGLGDDSIRVFYDGQATQGVLSGVDQVVVHPYSRQLYVAEDGGDLQLVQIVFEPDGGASIAPFLQFVGHDKSEVTGPAFSPDGSRLYVSSQRGTDGATGVTFEVRGPFEQWPGSATVSGRWRAERIP